MKLLDVTQIQRIEYDILKEVLSIFQRYEIQYYALYGTVLGSIRHNGSIPWDSDIDLGVSFVDLSECCSVLRRELPSHYVLKFYDDDKDYPLLFPRVAVKNYSYSHLHLDLFPLIGASSRVTEQEASNNRYVELFNEFGIVKHKKVYAKNNLRRLGKRVLQLFQARFCCDTAESILYLYDQLCQKYPLHESEYVQVLCPSYGNKNFLKKNVFGLGRIQVYEGISLTIPYMAEEYLQHYYGDYKKYPSKVDREKGLNRILSVPEDFILFSKGILAI